MSLLPVRDRQRPVLGTAALDDLVGPPGYSYVCRRCDVYGYLPPGERKRCWSCESGDRLDRR